MPLTYSLPTWFASAVESLRSGDLDSWMNIYTDDAIHEFPFASDNAPSRLVGRGAIAAYLQHLPELVRFGSFTYENVRELGDELIIEATGHHRRVLDDAPRDVSYVWFIKLRDGKVSQFRDYMNPIQLSTFSEK